MIDKQSLEIGTKIYHRGRKEQGVYDESCFAMETMNPDSTSLFVSFKSDILEVDLKMCELIEFEPPRLCQKCFIKLNDNEYTMCTACGIQLHNKIGGS